MTTDNTPAPFVLQEPPMDAPAVARGLMDATAEAAAIMAQARGEMATGALVTVGQWAQAHGVEPRSARRYVQKGKLAAVMQDGKWMVPADAEVQESRQGATVARRDQAPAARVPATPRAAAMTLEDHLAGQTAYLDLATAARLLGIPADVLVRQREEFGTVRYGDLDPKSRRRAWVVPAATVRKIAGLR